MGSDKSFELGQQYNPHVVCKTKCQWCDEQITYTRRHMVEIDTGFYRPGKVFYVHCPKCGCTTPARKER